MLGRKWGLESKEQSQQDQANARVECVHLVCRYFLGHIDENKRTPLLKDISHIHFTHLFYLGINGNQIDSIEGIAAISMLPIRQLFISNHADTTDDNNIRCVRVMRKAQWPSLFILKMRKGMLMRRWKLYGGCRETNGRVLPSSGRPVASRVER